jgi:hypothetical protein
MAKWGFLVACIVGLSSWSAWAHPGHFGLLKPAEVQKAVKRALSETDAKDLRARLAGSWKLTGYRLLNQGDYMEVALSKEKIDETRESWLFRPNGQFRHLMSKSLWFTGRWEVVEGLWREGVTDEATSRGYFVIRTYDISTSFMQKRSEEFFVGTFLDNWRGLAIFYLGADMSGLKRLQQASTFERAPYGAR